MALNQHTWPHATTPYRYQLFSQSYFVHFQLWTGPASMVASPSIGWKPVRWVKRVWRRKRKRNVKKLLRTPRCDMALGYAQACLLHNGITTSVLYHILMLCKCDLCCRYVWPKLHLPDPRTLSQDKGSDPVGKVNMENLNRMRQRAEAAAGASCAQSSEAITNSFLCVGFLIDDKFYRYLVAWLNSLSSNI